MPNTHSALVSERGWTPEAYEQWLAHMLTCALLPEKSDETAGLEMG